MPRCPSCSKVLPSDNAVLRHLNQPTSRCFGWVDNLVQIGELLEQNSEEKNIRTSPKSPELANWQPTGEWSALDDEMDVDRREPELDSGTLEEFPGAARVFAHQQNSFLDHFDRDQFSQERRTNLYYPFASRADWEFGLWLTRSGLSMAAIDSLLSLELVSFHVTRLPVPVTKVHIFRSRRSPSLFGRHRSCVDSSSFFPRDPNGDVVLFQPKYQRSHQFGYFTATRLNAWRLCLIILCFMISSPSSLIVCTELQSVSFGFTVNG
jgi:hypothetical protein